MSAARNWRVINMAFTRTLYRLGFEISPVILCDGVASAIPGGMLPIVALTQSASFVTGILAGGIDLIDLDKYFCHWRAAPGGTLINDDIGRYPFANQTVAANAIIAQPLNQSLIMTAPINSNTGAMTKLATISAMQAVLQAHRNLGGTYTLATPANIMSGCILRSVRDITPGNQATPQDVWQWDFEQPLVTETAAQSAINSFLSKIDGGDKVTTSAWTNTSAALGNTSLGGTVSSVADNIIGLIGKLGL